MFIFFCYHIIQGHPEGWSFPFAEGVSVNADNKNAEEHNTSTSERPDISYGGCRYRLSYDLYENPCRRKRKLKASSVFLTVGIVALFVAVGFFILRYYNRNIKDYYEKEVQNRNQILSCIRERIFYFLPVRKK